MDQSDSRSRLEIDAAYYNHLDIASFSQMLKDPSYCYKFYWLEAIVRLITAGVTDTTFDEIIDEMICSAWYSVSVRGKINLPPHGKVFLHATVSSFLHLPVRTFYMTR